MSQKYYKQLCQETQNNLGRNFNLEAKINKCSPFQDINFAKWLIGHLYMNYIQIANRLDKCYDQMVHPQKRELTGRLLDLVIGRILELKATVTKIELDNYCFFDNVLIELKLTPQDMEIHIPRYYWHDKERVKAHRRKLINKVFEEAERERFRTHYLEKVPEEAREEAWEKYLMKEEQQRQEKEKLEEQQKKMAGGRLNEISSLEKLIKEMNEPEPSETEGAVVDSVCLIQRHERARQGRVQAAWAKKYKRMKEQGTFAKRLPDNEAFKAAAIIQYNWRKYRQRDRRRKHAQKLLELLGMAEPSFKDNSGVNKLKKIEKLRRKIREANQREYEGSIGLVKEQLAVLYSNQIEEDITDEIRAWFQSFFDSCGFLPDFPPPEQVLPKGNIFGVPKVLGPDFAEKAFPQVQKKLDNPLPTTALGVALCGLTSIGGSALVTAGHWIEPQEFLICQKELEKGSNTSDKSKKEPDKKGGTNDKKPAEKKKGPATEFQLPASNFVQPLKKAVRDYKVEWMDLDERNNYEQRYIYDMVKENKFAELSMEIRSIVDEVMRLELDILKDALESDKNQGRKKKAKKSPKPQRLKVVKEKKDPTGHRTLDDLFMELFKNGIIKDYEEAYLKDYVGERSYCAFEFRQKNMEWPPSTGDVKELILQLCILPLGSSIVHQMAPLVKSVCLIGSENSGKEFLGRIICSETSAVMFDLTPANLVGKYPGKGGLKMLEHLIEKMSRTLQPSVIFIDGTEKTFYKKVPKEERHLDPKRTAGLINKLLKGIKPTDQILLVGVCSQPWLANTNKFLKAYQQLIFVPQMDYSSYFLVWKTLLMAYHSVPRTFDVSCLARASTGYSVKAIIDTIKNVLTTERISISSSKPYTHAEFLEELFKQKPDDDKMTEKCINFYENTDLPKKRRKRLNELNELEKGKKKAK
ncbi:hypothetical protein RUM44_005527 [Polyplax serrata]|uniref:ATPase AAA-type core domain-containing protein n=1 Tax=Polyplax serrata TaxID=468196 RepID=A0ABR1ADN0_POLSC